MRHPNASQIVIGFVIFLFFLLITFPFQNLRSYVFKKIYDASGIIVTADSMSPNILGWPGVSLSNSTVTIPTGSGDIALSSKGLVTRARLAGFLPPIPAVSLSLSGLKGGGDVFARVARSGDVVKILAEADSTNLAQILIPGFPEPIPGKLNMDTNLSVDGRDLSKSTGTLDLDIEKTMIPALNLQGIILPVLNLGDVKIKLAVKNGAVEILNFKLGSKTSDLSGTLTGEMRLGQTIYSSAVNLTLKLSLSPAYIANPQGATLVSLLESYKNPNGEYGLKWNATVQDMMTGMGALPQKVSN